MTEAELIAEARMIDHGAGCDGPLNCTCGEVEPVDTENGLVWYTVPVCVEVRDGEVWSVSVCDEQVTLDEDQPTASPEVVAIADNNDKAWPHWSFG